MKEKMIAAMVCVVLLISLVGCQNDISAESAQNVTEETIETTVETTVESTSETTNEESVETLESEEDIFADFDMMAIFGEELEISTLSSVGQQYASIFLDADFYLADSSGMSIDIEMERDVEFVETFSAIGDGFDPMAVYLRLENEMDAQEAWDAMVEEIKMQASYMDEDLSPSIESQGSVKIAFLGVNDGLYESYLYIVLDADIIITLGSQSKVIADDILSSLGY